MTPETLPQPAVAERIVVPGTILNQYRIEELLGEGATGRVFRARDLRLRRQVAVKVLRRDPQIDQVAWYQMLHEARATSHLCHPGFCTIYEVAEDQGQTYIAMEYVQGHSLKQLLQDKGLAKELVLLYGCQLAAALAHAHERGIVHGDIKSSNVIVKNDGTVKLLDLGLAMRRPSQVELDNYSSPLPMEKLGGARGTLPYVSPEILRGEPAGVQSDIWALGTLLYEMTAGRLPFTGRTCFEVSLAIMVQPIPALPRHTGSRLAAIIRRCLARDCTVRYTAARQVRDEIERMLLSYRQYVSVVRVVS